MQPPAPHNKFHSSTFSTLPKVAFHEAVYLGRWYCVFQTGSKPASQESNSSLSSRSEATGQPNPPPMPHMRGEGARDVPLGSLLWFAAGGIGPSPSLNRLDEVRRSENEKRKRAKQRHKQQMVELQAEEKRKQKEKSAGAVGLLSLLLPTVKKVVVEKVIERKVEETKKEANDAEEMKAKEGDKAESIEEGKERKEEKKDEQLEKAKEEVLAPEMSGANGP